MDSRFAPHAKLVAVGAVVVAFLAVLLLFLWQIVHVVLVVFAGILFALFLRSVADFISSHTGISSGWALAFTLVALAGAVVTGGFMFGARVAGQVDDLAVSLTESAYRARDWLDRYQWGHWLLSQIDSPEALARPGVLGRIPGMLSSTLNFVAGVVIVLFVGIYVAASPRVYSEGLLRLIPRGSRPRAAEVLGEIGHILRRWLVGQFAIMIVVGVMTWIGFMIIGLPLALTLGLLAAILNFIPYIGPTLAFIPPVLVGLVQSPTTALYVAILYLGVQGAESYLVTPQIQRRAVFLPPALLITMQIALGILFGFLGIVLATPITAVLLVLVKMLYVRDVLDEPVQLNA